MGWGFGSRQRALDCSHCTRSTDHVRLRLSVACFLVVIFFSPVFSFFFFSFFFSLLFLFVSPRMFLSSNPDMSFFLGITCAHFSDPRVPASGTWAIVKSRMPRICFEISGGAVFVYPYSHAFIRSASARCALLQTAAVGASIARDCPGVVGRPRVSSVYSAYPDVGWGMGTGTARRARAPRDHALLLLTCRCRSLVVSSVNDARPR